MFRQLTKQSIFWLFVLCVYSCSPASLTDFVKPEASGKPAKAIDVHGVRIDAELLEELERKAGISCAPWDYLAEKISREGDVTNYQIDSALVFKSLEREKAFEIVKEYSEKIASAGNFMFVTNMGLVEGKWVNDVVVRNQTDAFEMMDLMGVAAVNYDLYTEDIVEQLHKWDKNLQLRIIYIDYDNVEAIIEKMPNDLSGFAAEVYEFCPDVIDQGYEDMDALIEGLRETQRLYLWWD